MSFRRREDIVGGEFAGESGIGLDARSVGHGLSGTERPARSAVGLISDVSDAGAVGPLLSCVEAVGDGGLVDRHHRSTVLVRRRGSVLHIHQLLLQLLYTEVGRLGLPQVLLLVDIVDESGSGEGLGSGLDLVARLDDECRNRQGEQGKSEQLHYRVID